MVWRSDASASAPAKSGLVATILNVYVYCNNLSFICLRNGKTPILTYEKSFKRSNFLKLLTYFQNNKYSLNGIIVVFLFLCLLFFS